MWHLRQDAVLVNMMAVNVGEGPWNLLLSVTCPVCGPRRWTTFTDDPTQRRITWPVVVRQTFLDSWTDCGRCGNPVACRTLSLGGVAIWSPTQEDVFDSDGEPLYRLHHDVTLISVN